MEHIYKPIKRIQNKAREYNKCVRLAAMREVYNFFLIYLTVLGEFR